ncbi:Glycosyl transferase family 2 [Pustulibacterium marinum]|uniref:Glycosyl transferase family 2 n=1 Tax=Pustulibacterium marinum TaxID=1224947 RepID=A0A1I7F291_9FLAO|nr:glycosyltransferase [Pustulibacterium marinum]SFU30277.1 Glycosyl transferase family 2 [Pustulibacterium marinum]
MNNSSVAVLMSVYRKEQPKYLDLAMHSIWTDQILKPTQIILVEDGALTPELYDSLEQWKQELGDVLIIHKNKENLGLTKSLNIGLNYVTAKYVARMDSDDVSLPERFSKQVAFLEAHKDIAVVGANAQEIDEDNNYTDIRVYPETNDKILSYICKATPLQHSLVMIRRSIFDEGITYNEEYRMTQDLALWFDVLAAGHKIANIPEILFLFRITKDTFSRRNKSKAFHEFKIYMKGIAKLKGVTFRYVYPISRLALRLMPQRVIKLVYDSKFRKKVLK